MSATLLKVDDEPLNGRDKGIPRRAIGLTTTGFLAAEPRLSEFWTPLLVLDDAAMRHNLDTMRSWCSARGLDHMPHGKTTMAPALWQRQLDAGCLGITLATMGQVRTGRTFGLSSIMLANAVVDQRSLAYLVGELADPALRFVCWVDSIDTVVAMERGVRAADAVLPRPIDVLVELGVPGSRTGARSLDEARRVAERMAASDVLRLAGVAGWEGSLGHDRTPETLRRVREFLGRQVELHEDIRHLYGPGDTFVTAGGSLYFDLVAEAYAAARAASDADSPADGRRTHFTLRSGAYIVHDDGHYREFSPFDGGGDTVVKAEGEGSADAPRLRNALHGAARVVSHPEPSLALLDGGKRDFPYDEGLPIPREIADELGAEWSPLRGAEIVALNDQHAYLRLGESSAAPAPVSAPIGAVVALGLSHPCTAFDKWRVIPVVEAWGSDRVVDLVRTYF
jgi:D-serine deaminase-like pyridoxal phosphate-dependent protein